MSRAQINNHETVVKQMLSEGALQVEIAAFVGCSRPTLSRWMKSKKLTSNLVDRRWLTHLTSRQKSIIWGTVLGDGCLRIPKTGKNARLQLDHSRRQSGWLIWKYEELRNLFASSPREYIVTAYKGNVVRHEKIQASTRCHPILTDVYKKFYPDGKKVVTASILRGVDDLALAVWFCDDGSVNRNNYSLCLGNLTEAEYCLVQTWFEKDGLPTTRVNHKDARCVTLNFHQTSMIRLCRRIRKHVPECMAWKLE